VPANRVFLFQARVFEQPDSRTGEHFTQDLFGNMRFMEPGDLIAILAQHIMPADAKVELESIPADDFFPAVVGVAETARNHASNMSGGFEECGLHSFTGRRHSGYHAARRSSVDNDVEGLRGSGYGITGDKEKRETAGSRHQFKLDQIRPGDIDANNAGRLCFNGAHRFRMCRFILTKTVCMQHRPMGFRRGVLSAFDRSCVLLLLLPGSFWRLSAWRSARSRLPSRKHSLSGNGSSVMTDFDIVSPRCILGKFNKGAVLGPI
jgi:hypothetical protein